MGLHYIFIPSPFTYLCHYLPLLLLPFQLLQLRGRSLPVIPWIRPSTPLHLSSPLLIRSGLCQRAGIWGLIVGPLIKSFSHWRIRLLHGVRESEPGVRKRGDLSFFLSRGVLWATLLRGSERASLKGRLDSEDNRMLDDEGFKP